MSRRLTAAAALAVLAVATLPTVPAFASAASNAVLTAGQAVYPGAERPFTIRVTNSEAMLVGKTINEIQVSLPIGSEITLGSTAGTAPGFPTAKKSTVTDPETGEVLGQFLTYEGGALRPGSSVDVSFPASVGAPFNSDVTGLFEVLVSSDGGRTFKDAKGSLATRVQVLEVLQEGLKPVAPTRADGKGVTDRSGTAGQDITYATSVRNYAESALQVTTSIGSALGDATKTPASFPVQPGQVGSGNVVMTLGAAASDRTTAFTTKATAPGAEAPAKSDAFTVQAPATLALSGLQPTRTPSGTGSGRDFTVSAAKTGSQALEVTSSTLTLGTATGVAQPASFATGNQNGSLTYSIAEVKGADGEIAASALSRATDDNLADYGYSSDLGKVVIDNLAPLLGPLSVVLPNDADGKKQTAIKNGDQVTVTGTLTNALDLEADSLKVVLQPNDGPAQPFTLSTSGSGDSRTFTGTLDTADFTALASSFSVVASVADTAGNTDGESATGFVIDNLLPKLIGDGVILKANEVEVTFQDATGVFGGCNANAYTVDGSPGSVTDVRGADGKPCADNTGVGGRILTLRKALAVDETPEITYNFNPSTRSLITGPTKDGAGNDAISQTVQTVNQLRPQLPTLTAVERRDGASDKPFEAAYLDTAEKAYYTNVAGTDALQLTVAGIRQNYTLEVLNGSTVVASKKFTAAPAPLASSYSGSITAPLPTTVDAASGAGTHAMSVRFKALNGLTGEAVPFTVVFEQVLPTLGAASVTGSSGEGTYTINAPFTEKVVSGTDFAEDWLVAETIQTANGTTTRVRNVNTVGGSDQSGRTLDAKLLDPSKFQRTHYGLRSTDGARYEDRAGNLMLNTITITNS